MIFFYMGKNIIVKRKENTPKGQPIVYGNHSNRIVQKSENKHKVIQLKNIFTDK